MNKTERLIQLCKSVIEEGGCVFGVSCEGVECADCPLSLRNRKDKKCCSYDKKATLEVAKNFLVETEVPEQKEQEDISYSSLRRNFNVLVKTVMGSDYSNDAINVISSDIQAIKDVRRRVDNLKLDVKMWRNIAIVMMLISFLLLIFK